MTVFSPSPLELLPQCNEVTAPLGPYLANYMQQLDILGGMMSPNESYTICLHFTLIAKL